MRHHVAATDHVLEFLLVMHTAKSHSSIGTTSKPCSKKTRLKTVKLGVTSEPPSKKLRTVSIIHFDIGCVSARPGRLKSHFLSLQGYLCFI